MTNHSRQLAETIYGIDRLANSLATHPQLAHSTVSGGLEFTDGDGNTVGVIDGDGKGGLDSKPFVDPVPAIPSLPEVTADAGFIRVRWDGLWADAEDPRLPADPSVINDAKVQVIETHISLDPNFTPNRVHTFAGAFAPSEAGGAIVVGPLVESGEYWVGIRARSVTGQLGELSGKVPIQISGVQIDSKLFELALRDDEIRKTADGKNEVFYGDTEPEPRPVLDEEGNPVYDTDGNQLFEEFSDNDLWFGPGNMPHLYDETTGEWESAGDARVAAIEDAQDKLREDLDAVVVDGSGMKSFYRPTEPTAEESSEGDLWFNTSESGKNAPHIYRNGAWVSVADARVSAIEQAQAALEGEVTAAEARAIAEAGDLADAALDAANSHTDGRVFDSTQIADDAITTPKLKAGAVGAVAIAAEAIEGKHIKAGSITADKVLIGQGGNLLSNPDFANGAEGWAGAPDVRPGGGKDGATAIFIEASSSTVGHYLGLSESSDEYRFAVTPGEEYRISGYAAAEEGIVENGARIYVRFYTPTDKADSTYTWGSPSYVGNSEEVAPYSWGQADGIVTAPEGAIECVVGLYSASTHQYPMQWCLPSAQQAVGSTLIQKGAITTEKIATGSITAESGIIGSINAGTILFGEMDGARIKVNSIAADKVLIGGESNFFARGVLHSETDIEAWPGDPGYRADGPGGVGGAAAYPAGQGTTGFESMGRFTVTPGNIIAFEVNVSSVNADSNIRFEVRNQDGKIINGWEALPGPSEFEGGFSYPVQGAALSGSWRLLGAQVSVPPKTHEIYLSKVHFNHSSGPTQDGEVWVSGLKLYRLTTSTLIADGAITTGKIATGAITAESGIIGSLDAGVITTGELRGELIRAGSVAAAAIAADAIDGKTITGAKIRTSAAGARVEMNTTGLRQYNKYGQLMADMSGGMFTGVGDFQTGLDGERRVVISNKQFGNAVGLRFFPDASGKEAGITAIADGGGWTPGTITVTSASTGGIHQELQHKAPTSSSYGSTFIGTLDGGTRSGGYLDVSEDGSARVRSKNSKNLELWSSGDAEIDSDSAVNILARDGSINIESKTGDVRLAPDSSGKIDFYLPGSSNFQLNSLSGSSGGWPSLIVDDNMNVFWESSSRKYKVAEEPITTTVPDLEERLLSVDAVTWYDKEDAEKYAALLDSEAEGAEPTQCSESGHDLARIPGVIAEDLHAAGLGLFVSYGEDGEPMSVSYDRIGPALIPIVRSQRDRIDDLETRLAALEAAA